MYDGEMKRRALALYGIPNGGGSICEKIVNLGSELFSCSRKAGS